MPSNTSPERTRSSRAIFRGEVQSLRDRIAITIQEMNALGEKISADGKILFLDEHRRKQRGLGPGYTFPFEEPIVQAHQRFLSNNARFEKASQELTELKRQLAVIRSYWKQGHNYTVIGYQA